MGDLFGDWVPDEWIQAVFDACEAAPQHRYLFLTKNPARYSEFKSRIQGLKNCWIGNTVTGLNADTLYDSVWADSFISFEPLLCEIRSSHIEDLCYATDWVIIGAETGNREGKVTPRRGWVDAILSVADERGIPVFMKDSLIPTVGEENMRRELPWEWSVKDGQD
jgi:protein gp37